MSVSSTGSQGNGPSYFPAISGSGAFVAFTSRATDLVSGDTNGGEDVFLRGSSGAVTERGSLTSTGDQYPSGGASWSSVSDDGRFVEYEHADKVWVRDRQLATTVNASVSSTGEPAAGPPGEPANIHNYGGRISGDGRYVLFTSTGTNLVSQTDQNSTAASVFVHDLSDGSTEMVSIDPSGDQVGSGSAGNAISDDGRYVVFIADGQTYLRDRVSQATELVSVSMTGQRGSFGSTAGDVSSDGRFVAFVSDAPDLVPGDPLVTRNVFVRDRQSATTEMVDVSSSGAYAGADAAGSLGMSDDGRYVVFGSRATNLVAGDTNNADDIFLRDRTAAATQRVSVGADGQQANQESTAPAVSDDGQRVVFQSWATNLVTAGQPACSPPRFGPGTCTNEVFLRDLGSQATNGAGQTLPAGGGTVATNEEVDATDPVGTSVTSPSGGEVTITETTQTDPAPSGYNILGQQVNIEAPAASADNPLRLLFRLDASILPEGGDASTLQVFRDGSPMGDCTGAAGTASPDPCVADRQALEGGDVALTILTSHASAWNFGLHEAFAFQGPFLPPSPANTYKAGSTIPVRFSLGGNQGLKVLASGYPRSRPCVSTEAGIPTSGSLKYDAKKAQYVYTWLTSKQWSSAAGGGPCREFVLRLIDGSTHKEVVTFGR